jgi:N-acyl-L-homoserine lactone synthetase
MDAFADLALRRVAPARFDVAATAAEREAVWRLRAQIMVERGWIPAGSFPDGMERDRFDDRAMLIVGWHGGDITATARLVFPAPGERLPTEAAFGLTAEPAGEIANLDRVIVPRAWSGPAHRMLAALAGYSWQVLRAHGYTCFIGPVSPAALRLYRQLGWVGTPLGPPRVYWGEERFSCRFCPR